MIRVRRLSRIVECAECNAPKWERCTSANGKPLDVVHQVRTQEARKAAKKHGSAYLATSPMELTNGQQE